jgi:1-acyl-sn-glycerol-3-phosphate acyltransferase
MRTIILLIIYIVTCILIIPLLLICPLFKWPEPIISVGRGSLRLGWFVLGIDIEVSGLENFDKNRSYVFMANHQSMLDVVVIALIPQFVHVIAKKEMFKVPVIGQGMKIVEYVSVDRKGKKGGRKSIAKAVSLIKEKNYSFLIFPEGTRSLNGKLQQFRRGGFYLAVNSQASIVPITITGSFELMPKYNFFIKKGKITVAFHKPVPVQGYDESSLSELMDKVRYLIKIGKEPK